MAARAIGTASISFGLVSIPVKLYSGRSTTESIRFNLLHGECGTRLKQQYVCPKDQEVVSRDEMVKGYEFAKGRYVTFTDEEVKGLQEPPSHAIEIEEFLALDLVDPIYFDKAYYLGPDQGGDKPYQLLANVMRSSNRVALARYAARGKDYLVMLRPMGDGLIMQQLLYANEVRPADDIPTGEASVQPKELKLAQQIVDQITTDRFEPSRYEDSVVARMKDAIDKKVEGQEIVIGQQEQPQAQIVDLMEALKASLGELGDDGKVKRKGPKAVAAAKKKVTARKRKA